MKFSIFYLDQRSSLHLIVIQISNILKAAKAKLEQFDYSVILLYTAKNSRSLIPQSYHSPRWLIKDFFNNFEEI